MAVKRRQSQVPVEVRPGVFRIRWLEDGREGAYRQETLRGITYKRATEVLKERRGDATKEREANQGSLTIKKLVEKWQASRDFTQLSPHWQRTVNGFLYPPEGDELRSPKNPRGRVRRAGTYVMEQLGNLTMRKLRTHDLSAFRDKRLDEGAAPSTVNHEVGVVVRVLKWAHEQDLIPRNPVKTVRRERENKRKAFLAIEEWQRFRRAFDDPQAWTEHMERVRWLGPVVVDPEKGTERRYGGGLKPDSAAADEYRLRVRAAMDVFEALLLTSSRLGEMLGLRWDDVNLRAGTIAIEQTKTKRRDKEAKVKILVLSPEMRALLKRQRRGVGQALVFEKPSGGPWDSVKLLRIFKLARKLSGVNPEVTIHSLRHTAASWLIEAGVAGESIQETLGHGNLAMTDQYAKRTAELTRRSVEELGRLSRGAQGGRALTRPLTRPLRRPPSKRR